MKSAAFQQLNDKKKHEAVKAFILYAHHNHRCDPKWSTLFQTARARDTCHQASSLRRLTCLRALQYKRGVELAAIRWNRARGLPLVSVRVVRRLCGWCHPPPPPPPHSCALHVFCIHLTKEQNRKRFSHVLTRAYGRMAPMLAL